jgi:hypothetical protein
MSRPGGNPNLTQYAFQAADEESLKVRISIKVSPAMAERLYRFDNKSDFIRECIRRGLDESQGKI